MRGKSLTYIAVIMSMALVGLLSVQYYWTRHIIQINREFVASHIDAAMREAVPRMAPVMDQLVATALFDPAETEDFLERQAPLISQILESSFAECKLKTRIEWGIYSQYGGKLVCPAQSDNAVKLLQSQYNYALFASLDIPVPFRIAVYLPRPVSAVMPHIWFLTVSSFLLIALIIYAFVYTVLSLWRQKKLNEMKSDLINHVTHEIKTPVSTIGLICESLNDPDMRYDERRLKEVLEIIRHENKRLESLSRQIIEISKMEKGEFFLNKTLFSLHKAIEEAVNNAGFQVMHKSGRIIQKLEAENDEIFGDRNHIVNIVANLIDNANKYCESKPCIEISTANAGEGVRVDVKDNGIGIAKAHLRKVFDKLYRVPTGNLHNVKGFGLGLSYVKSMMEQHGGRVWVESEPGKGSVFHLYFSQKQNLK